MPQQPGLDIAELGLRVDARQVQGATAALNELSTAGLRTEGVVVRLTQRERELARENAIVAERNRQMAALQRQLSVEMGFTADQMGQVAQKSRLAGAPIARLNNSMVVLARQAAGAHPVVGQLADAVGTFAIGTAKMVPILAGLAAIAVAFKAITRESREAKSRLAEAREELERLATLQGLPVGGETVAHVGVVRQELYRLEAERGRLQRQLETEQNLGLQRGLRDRIAAIDEQLPGLRDEIAAGVQAVSDAEFDDFLDKAHERLEEAQYLIERDVEAFDQAFQEAERRAARAAGFALRDRYQVDPSANNEPFVNRVREASKELRKQETIEQKILDMEERRVRAMDALVNSLENVGRAYGGVVDQIAALTAATISIWRNGPLPNETRTDRAIGFGTAALTGAGFGFSTGSPGLGGIGGGIAGGLAAGPAGAIVGAVGGIVGGLIESGRRAEEARRIWRRALEDFRNMFADLSPLDQNLQNIDRIFEDLVAGLGFINNAADVAAYRELVEIRERNIELAREQAESERDLYDARFRSFNAPSGFNAQYYGAQFGAPAPTDPASTGGSAGSVNVTINIDESVDPDETAARTVAHIERFARRGGYSFSAPTGR